MGSWSQCASKMNWGLPMNRPLVLVLVLVLECWLGESETTDHEDEDDDEITPKFMGTMRCGNELEALHEPAAQDDSAKEKAASYSNEFRICRCTPCRERAPFAGMECAGKPDV